MGIAATCLSWTKESNDFFNEFIFEVEQCFAGKTSRFDLKIFYRCRIYKSWNALPMVNYHHCKKKQNTKIINLNISRINQWISLNLGPQSSSVLIYIFHIGTY